MKRLFAVSHGKRAVEQAWLAYTPIWGAVTGVIMLGGFAERWGDVPLMLFGSLLAAGCLAAPLVRSRDPEVVHAWAAMSLAIVILAFGLNYLQTPYFFDVLHMRYGFHARWRIEHNPIFLYLVTVPYFATYSVLACMTVRLALRAPRVVRVAAVGLVPFVLAFFETVLNANPFMTRLFCYDDLPLMLWFGTLSYGVSFVLALPMWWSIAEPDSRLRSIAAVALAAVVVCVADRGVLEVLRIGVAPHVTTVVDGSEGGLGGCLSP